MNKGLVYSYICELETILKQQLESNSYVDLIVSEIVYSSIITLHDIDHSHMSDEETAKGLVKMYINSFYKSDHIEKVIDKYWNPTRRLSYGFKTRVAPTASSLANFRRSVDVSNAKVQQEVQLMLDAIDSFVFKCKYEQMGSDQFHDKLNVAHTEQIKETRRKWSFIKKASIVMCVIVLCLFVYMGINNWGTPSIASKKYNDEAIEQQIKNDEIEKLFHTLKNEGYETIGTLDEFKKCLSNPYMRRWAYMELKNYKDVVGTYEEFEEKLGFSPSPQLSALDEKIFKLYQTLKDEGFESIGTFDEFKASLSYSYTRKWVYKVLVECDYDMESYEEFEKNIGIHSNTEKVVKGSNQNNYSTNQYQNVADALTKETFVETIFENGDQPYIDDLGSGIYKAYSLSKLTISNHTNTDAVVFLYSRDGDLVRHAFIGKDSEFTIDAIPPCECITKVMFGNRWNSDKYNGAKNPKGGFMQDVHYTKSSWSDSFDFYLIYDEFDNISYPTYSLTLHAVRDGNFKTSKATINDMFN